jgi:hypothetical protein
VKEVSVERAHPDKQIGDYTQCLGDSVLITKTRRRKKEHFNNS